MCCGFELGNAHSRSNLNGALGCAIVPGLYFRTCRSVEQRSEREVVPRKGSEVRNGNHIGHFSVRERRGRAVGSHSASIAHAIGCAGFSNHRRVGSLGSVSKVISGSPNKSVKPFACGSLGRSALRACSGLASPFLPEQALHAERRLPWRYAFKR